MTENKPYRNDTDRWHVVADYQTLLHEAADLALAKTWLDIQYPLGGPEDNLADTPYTVIRIVAPGETIGEAR